MLDRTDGIFARLSAHVAAASAAFLMIGAGAAWPQAAPPSLGVQSPPQQTVPDRPASEQSEPAPPSAPPAQEENPGLINEIGKLLEKSKSILPTLKSTQETIGDWNARARDATKDAGGSLSRLAKPSSMVTGRTVCPVSANGAPDCKLGAVKLCQTKGFAEGKSLTADSAETCSAKVLIPGRQRKPDDCRTDNFVTRALCQ